MPNTRVRNSPPIRVLVKNFLQHKKDKTASASEIYEHIFGSGKIILSGKTPKNSIISVIYRMPEIKRIGNKQYKLIEK